MAGSHVSLLESALITQILHPASRNNGATLSAVLDMQGYENVDILVNLGVTDNTLDVKLTESVNADGSSPSDVTGAALTQLSATGDNHCAVLSVAATVLTKRYLVVSFTHSNGTGGIAGCTAFQYPKSGVALPTQGATVTQFKKVGSQVS